MRARLTVTAEWTVHEGPDETDEFYDVSQAALEDLVSQFAHDPEALAEFLDRDEVVVEVTGEWT